MTRISNKNEGWEALQTIIEYVAEKADYGVEMIINLSSNNNCLIKSRCKSSNNGKNNI